MLHILPHIRKDDQTEVEDEKDEDLTQNQLTVQLMMKDQMKTFHSLKTMRKTMFMLGHIRMDLLDMQISMMQE